MKNTWQGGIVINMDAFLDKEKKIKKEMYDKYFDPSVKSYEEICKLADEDVSALRPNFLNKEVKNEIAESIRDSKMDDWVSYKGGTTTTYEGKAEVGIDLEYTVFLIHDPAKNVLNPFMIAPTPYRDLIDVPNELLEDKIEGELHTGQRAEFKESMSKWQERNTADEILSDEDVDREMKELFGEGAMTCDEVQQILGAGMELDEYLDTLEAKFEYDKANSFGLKDKNTDDFER